jgi:hypothetical protein
MQQLAMTHGDNLPFAAAMPRTIIASIKNAISQTDKLTTPAAQLHW